MSVRETIVRAFLKLNIFGRKPKTEDYSLMTEEQATKKIVESITESKEFLELVQIMKNRNK